MNTGSSGTVVFVAAIAGSLKAFVGPVARDVSAHGFRCVAVVGRGTDTTGLDRDFTEVHEITPIRRKGALDVARASLDLRRVIRRERAALLHLHTPYAVAVGRAAARLTRTPHIAVVHGTLFDAAGSAGRLFSAIETATAWATPQYVTMNPDDWAQYRSLAPSSEVHLAPCGGAGIDESVLAVSNDPCERPSTAPRVLIMGRLTPDKDLDLAVAAWRRARRSVPELELHIVGSTAPGEPGWTPPVEPGVVVRPWTADPGSELRMADVVLSASPREGFPMAIAEALAVGTPVVAVDNRGTRAVATSVGEGLSLVPANATALATGLLVQLRAGTVQVDPEALRSWKRDAVVAYHTRRILDVLHR